MSATVSKYDEIRQRQDRSRIYMFGSDEWTEMMVAFHNAIDACMSASAYDNAEAILLLMEGETKYIDEHGFGDEYDEILEARKKEYEPWQPFATGDSAIEPF